MGARTLCPFKDEGEMTGSKSAKTGAEEMMLTRTRDQITA